MAEHGILRQGLASGGRFSSRPPGGLLIQVSNTRSTPREQHPANVRATAPVRPASSRSGRRRDGSSQGRSGNSLQYCKCSPLELLRILEDPAFSFHNALSGSLPDARFGYGQPGRSRIAPGHMTC
eukprot:scaffold1085_cov407-Prasinococcus_capsulatus_cf.AAC.75